MWASRGKETLFYRVNMRRKILRETLSSLKNAIGENKLFYCPPNTKKMKGFPGKAGFRVISKPIVISWIMTGLRILVLTFWVHFPSSLSSEAVCGQQMDQIVAQLTH